MRTPIATQDILRFNGFAPDRRLVMDVGATLQWIEKLVPRNSSIGTSLRFVDGSYVCEINLHSIFGHFYGEGLHSSAQAAFDKATKRITALLRTWNGLE